MGEAHWTLVGEAHWTLVGEAQWSLVGEAHWSLVGEDPISCSWPVGEDTAKQQQRAVPLL